MPAWQYPQGLQSSVTDLIGADTNNNTQATTNVAANEDGSVLERLEQIQEAVNKGSGTALPTNKSIVDAMELQVSTGTTDIDDSVQTESTAFSILTIAPAAGCPLNDCEVWLDLAKATTGFAAVETSVTVQFAVARKVDGTNWRREAYVEAALSGTNAAGRMMKLTLGRVSVTESAAIYAVFSGDVTADMEIPYAVVYRALGAPTITPVAAG